MSVRDRCVDGSTTVLSRGRTASTALKRIATRLLKATPADDQFDGTVAVPLVADVIDQANPLPVTCEDVVALGSRKETIEFAFLPQGSTGLVHDRSKHADRKPQSEAPLLSAL